jgi:hypothetical protein
VRSVAQAETIPEYKLEKLLRSDQNEEIKMVQSKRSQRCRSEKSFVVLQFTSLGFCVDGGGFLLDVLIDRGE